MRLDLSPLLRGEHGKTIRVAGVHVSEPAANIDRRALTGAEDNAGESRTYRDGRVYRTAHDGALIEIPLPERVDATLACGGFLRCGEIALRVTDGAIERIFIRGPSLASLEIMREEDIERRFGAATGHERMLGWRIHHYPERGLAIAWHEKEHRIEHIALSAEPWHEPRLGTKELLAELAQAFDMLSQAGEIEPSKGSARARYRRVVALSRALGLGSVPDLLRGRFLDGELSAARRRVLEEIAACTPLRKPPRDSAAAMLFSHLLRYRRDVDAVVRATSGWLECSEPALLGMILTQNEIGRQLEALVVDIDRWLCTLMDPEQRTFELRSLVAQHGWPDVDLKELKQEETWG